MSKLDDAFLKAYAKVRGAGQEKGAGVSKAARESEAARETELREDPSTGSSRVLSNAESLRIVSASEADDERLLQLLKLDDGVVNVASFIAKTANGRTRGTAQRPQGGVADEADPLMPQTPEFLGNPVRVDGRTTQVIDSDHALRGPHFQPISLDLAALDVFAPVGSAVLERQRKAPVTAAVTAPVAAAVDSQQTNLVVEQPFAAVVRVRNDQPAPESVANTQRVFVRTDIAHEAETRVNNERSDACDSSGSFAAPRESADAEGPVVVPFLAAWEVDRFEFEDIIWELSAETSPLWSAVEQLEIACREGLKVLAITSPSRSQGRSTLAITLARMLAATGMNVALLDGDIDRPSLADKLRLEIRLGWGDAVRTGLSVEEVAVQSVEDGFTVLPSAAPDAAKGVRPAAETTGAMIDYLRSTFDLLIIDTANVNVIGGWIPGAEDGHIDAALVIQDVRNEDADAMQACLRRLQKVGIQNIGLVENFANA